MENTLVYWFLAASPIIVFLLAILLFNWGTSRASAFCWILTVIISAVFFGANFEVVVYSYIKAFLMAIDILLIIWTAILLYSITDQAGTITIFGDWISSLTQNRALKGLFLGWLFPSFLQGIGGFGVPVAIAAPLLVSTGFTPIQAMVMASIGHAWGVTFGSMASSFRTLMTVTGLPYQYLAPASSVLLGITSFLCGFLVCFIADGFRGIKNAFFPIIISGLILSVGEYLLATNGLYILAVTIPSLAALGFCYLLIAVRKKGNPELTPSTNKLLLSILPYLVLVSLTLLLNLSEPLKAILNRLSFSLSFPEISTADGFITPIEIGKEIRILSHPGFIILLTSIISYLIFIKRKLLSPKSLNLIMKRSANKSIETTIAVFTMIGIAVLMSHTRMIQVIASGISRVFNQDYFPLISPFIGAIGAFMTGSNNNSNVLFSVIQMHTAELLGLSVPLVLAAQTAGGALGSMMAPAKIVLGCATVNLEGSEGKVISRILVYGLGLILIIGIITTLLSAIGVFGES